MKDTKKIPWDAIKSKLRGDQNDIQEDILNTWLEDANNTALFVELEMLWKNMRIRGALVEPDKEKMWARLSKRTLERSKKRELRRNGLKWAAATLAAATLGFVLVTGVTSWWSTGDTVRVQVVENLSGKSRMSMPDGSEIWLHSNTDISYENGFGKDDRTVSVNGEAFFNVAKDEDKPFVVVAGDVRVKVHGTSFNVRSYASSDMVSVSLAEGCVSLSVGDSEHEMLPGQIATYDRNTGRLEITDGDIFMESLWASNRLRIEGRNLGDICRYLEKWYNTEIELDPRMAEAYIYSFTITDEPLEEILRIMNRINPIDYRFTESNGVIITPKPRVPVR